MTSKYGTCQTHEQQRHECEVRHVVKLYHAKGGSGVTEYLNLVEKHRGKEARDRLRMDALKEIKG